MTISAIHAGPKMVIKKLSNLLLKKKLLKKLEVNRAKRNMSTQKLDAEDKWLSSRLAKATWDPKRKVKSLKKYREESSKSKTHQFHKKAKRLKGIQHPTLKKHSKE